MHRNISVSIANVDLRRLMQSDPQPKDPKEAKLTKQAKRAKHAKLSSNGRRRCPTAWFKRSKKKPCALACLLAKSCVQMHRHQFH